MSTLTSLARQSVSEAISQWRCGRQPDAKAFLEQHPEVKVAPSLVIDLAYEEFCLRLEAGEHVDTEKFCGRFPTIQHSLARMLDVHRVLDGQGLGGALAGWPEPGTRWLDWELIEPLGRGAFSRVFLAREPLLGNREVVVKCSFAGPDEAFILGRLSHPNIVPIHSSQQDAVSGLAGTCMPLLGRHTLANVLDRLAAQGEAARRADVFRAVAAGQPLSPSPPTQRQPKEYLLAACHLLRKVAEGLAAAHRAGVIHGDIKPSNILLSFAGEPMLMDFNLSGGPGGDFARVGGTPPYIAPECLAEFLTEPKQEALQTAMTYRSDIFSLGVVLLELVLGKIPLSFHLRDPESLPKQQDWLKLIPTQLGAGQRIDRHVQSILQRCLAFDPAQRYQDAEALVRDLGEIAATSLRQEQIKRRTLLGAIATAVAITPPAYWAWNYRDPNSPEGLLERARSHVAQGELLMAGHELRELLKHATDPRIAAWVGYCLAASDDFHAATPHLAFACSRLEDSANLWNDAGFCSFRLSALQRAEAEYSEALRRQGNFQAAHHNRALLRMNGAARDGLPLPLNAWKDFECALIDAPPNAELHFDVARALAYAKKYGPKMDENLEHHIVAALIGGIELKSFTSSQFLFGDLNFAPLVKRAQESQLRVAPPAPLLLPPPFALPDWPLRA